jgi:monofunctional biosynthetic peptidoglycan transglycosylase
MAMKIGERVESYSRYRFSLVCMSLLLVCLPVMGGRVVPAQEKEKVVFSFEQQSEIEQWQNVDDPVMGGLSRSTIGATDKGTALFSGNVSLENFGGFASVRSKNADYDLGNYDGVAVRVRGDGKGYEIILKDETAFGGFSYFYKFNTPKGDWITVKAPFRDFAARFHGQVLGDRPPIEGRNVRSVGLLIADKQEGPFRLEINWIKAYRKN